MLVTHLITPSSLCLAREPAERKCAFSEAGIYLGSQAVPSVARAGVRGEVRTYIYGTRNNIQLGHTQINGLLVSGMRLNSEINSKINSIVAISSEILQ